MIVDASSGLIVRRVYERNGDGTLETLGEGDIDLRGKYVLPGAWSTHTHTSRLSAFLRVSSKGGKGPVVRSFCTS